jgi:glycosyltransferase involved in cell wall biosynthesis
MATAEMTSISNHETDPASTKRRILMLIENLSFPMDRRMRQEAMALRDAGYEVNVICPRGEHQDLAGYQNYEGVHVYRYPLYWQGSGGLGYILEYGWALSCTFALMLWVSLKHGFDYVHAANPPDLFFLLYKPFGRLGKKFVFDQHDLCPETYETKFQRRDWVWRLLVKLEGYTHRAADLVLVTNQSVYEIARTRGNVPREKLAIVRSGPDLEYFRRTAPQPKLKRGRPYLVAYLGVMSVQDGVDRVVQAAHHLQQLRAKEDVTFALIGKGDCFAQLNELSQSLGLNGTVKFTGRISDEEVLQYLSTADVCVAPDPPIPLNHMSTMNKIMEYMACGSPIVSFDLTESRYSASSAAVYVERDDPKLFAQAIHDLLEDPGQRRRIGEYGYDRVRNELAWSHSARNLIEAYSRLERKLSRQHAAVAAAD